jgi:asparagine synthase (glutamine-hydrolysing)
MTKQTATVALSGEGADELFGGYLTYRANDLARQCRRLPAGLLRLALGAARHWPVSNEKIGFEYKLKRFLAGCLMTPAQAHVYWNGAFSEAEKLALLQQPLPGALDGILKRLAGAGDRLAAYLHFDQQYYLPDDILVKVDRMSMAHAVEVRPPYLDHRLVEFAASLPASLKIDGARQKVILRRLMRGKLPDMVLRRKKEGFDIPAHDWLRGPLRPLVEDTLADAAPDVAGLFRPGAVADCARRHFERRANLGYHLWGLTILFLWMKRWRIQAEPDSQWALTPAASIFTSI